MWRCRGERPVVEKEAKPGRQLSSVDRTLSGPEGYQPRKGALEAGMYKEEEWERWKWDKSLWCRQKKIQEVKGGRHCEDGTGKKKVKCIANNCCWCCRRFNFTQHNSTLWSKCVPVSIALACAVLRLTPLHLPPTVSFTFTPSPHSSFLHRLFLMFFLNG